MSFDLDLAPAGIIDEEKQIKHSRLSQKFEDAIADPSMCQVRFLASLRCAAICNAVLLPRPECGGSHCGSDAVAPAHT